MKNKVSRKISISVYYKFYSSLHKTTKVKFSIVLTLIKTIDIHAHYIRNKNVSMSALNNEFEILFYFQSYADIY
jgi:hypothetical protein